MSIEAAAVVRKNAILAVVAADGRDHEADVRRLLKSVSSSGKKQQTYDAGQSTFHALRDNAVVFLCKVPRGTRLRFAFRFLDHVRDEFLKEFGLIARTVSRTSVEPEFAPVVSEVMSAHNRGDFDKTHKVQRALDDATASVRENIDKVLERTGKIDSLVGRSSELHAKSYQFRSQSRKLRRTFWWRNTKIYIIVGGLGLLLLSFVFMYACGGATFPLCRSGGADSGAGKDSPAPADAPQEAPAAAVPSGSGSGPKAKKRASSAAASTR